MIWPIGADGDVFRRLEADGFDFSQDHSIDFNVDFESWPPQDQAIKVLATKYPSLEVVAPDEEFDGYATFTVFGKLTYELVVQIQEEVTLLMKPFNGWCESWGVMH